MEGGPYLESQHRGPEGARLRQLQLDELLGELRVRLEAVVQTRDRVHALLDAVLAIGSNLDIETVLRRLVEAATALVDAEYGALGVIGEGGGIRQFITVGVDEETTRHIGHYPRGHGLLGLLIRMPRPVRVADISAHRESYGFPANHPPMRTFLGVPIRIRDEVFGNLYMTEKRGGKEFDDDDEIVLSALAVAAGVAIDNARLYDESRRRERWLEAVTDITRALLSGADPTQMQTAVVEHARSLAAADAAFLALPVPGSRDLAIEAAIGADAERLLGMVQPLDGSLTGRVYSNGKPELLTDVTSDEHNPQTLGQAEFTGPALFVPLGQGDAIQGVLAVVGQAGGQPWGSTVQDMLVAFADQVAVALELARSRIDAELLSVLEDRDRIARDLHDLVIQRLFAIGMSLSGIGQLVREGEVQHRIARAIDDLDKTIREIRSAIFSLSIRPEREEASPRAKLLAAVNDATGQLDILPSVRFDGAVDREVPSHIAERACTVLRESLSNVARHAEAGSVDVSVTTEDGQLVVQVEDDGVGIADDAPRSGLKNLEQRAVDIGGSMTVSRGSRGGTLLCWRVPLRTEA